ncbi:MAG: metallophosphoesterase [Solirubrobacterales bacterium]
MSNNLRRICKIYDAAEKVSFDNHSKIVLMSDCHRGTGNLGDDFYKNKDICLHALTYYYENNFTYIELGDGDELWENSYFDHILQTHKNVFSILSKFQKDNRLYFIYGNHDIVKRRKKFVKKHLFPLFGDIKIHEALILSQRNTNNEILLLHGHQVDFFNDRLWRVSRFLVRYLWGPLQVLGVVSPVNTSLSFCRKQTIDLKFMDWCFNENKGLAAGHTHNYLFPEPGTIPYFNTGCCIYPQGITSIEIQEGLITLTAWHSKTVHGEKVFTREVIGGPVKIQDYFTID